jgi:hypothetical protein
MEKKETPPSTMTVIPTAADNIVTDADGKVLSINGVMVEDRYPVDPVVDRDGKRTVKIAAAVTDVKIAKDASDI